MSTASTLTQAAQAAAAVQVSRSADVPAGCTAVVVPVPVGDLPTDGGWSAEQLASIGFTGATGQVSLLPGDPATVLTGLGDVVPGDGAAWRDAIGLAVRACAPHQRVAIQLGAADAAAVRAAVEGAILARYRYDSLRSTPLRKPLTELALIVDDADTALSAADLGKAGAVATALARDLANTPHNHLTASGLADIAVELAAEAGLQVEVWDLEKIEQERLGGLLAINAGSAAPARVIRLDYAPTDAPTAHLALVGKGIMYDSGGIGLKENNDAHAQMKNDMTGAADILAAMLQLPAIGGTARVTGWLMCTDNMPSSTASALGDVVTMRNGDTMEIVDTDAEGRVVMADGISLSVELAVDAIVDIATLTGSVSRALGPRIAGTVSSSDAVHDQISAAAQVAGEPVWRLPLAETYVGHLDSPVADVRNVAPVGIPDGLIAALFLHRFTAGVPWGHVDIAGTAWSSEDAGWRTPACSGFGARLILELARGYRSATDAVGD